MKTSTRGLLGALCLVTILAGTLAGSVDAKKRGVYEPPYKKGPSGGDFANFMHVDRQAGEIGILRAFPFPSPVVGCEPESHAGWATFRVQHRVDAPVAKVGVDYDRATLDSYSFLTLEVEASDGKWLGSATTQGPTAGDAGSLAASLGSRSPRRGEAITITFGVQLSSSCPQVGGATARFPSVRIKADE